jgi:prepilin-type N-terminal cleavage/methylation domain-containing protein
VRNQIRNQRGFTLIELVVVIAILGVLAAIAVPMITNYLDSAKERSWNAEQARIQNAVDAFYGSPSNTRFIGKRQYPLIGRGITTQASYTTATTTGTFSDDGDPFNGGSAELWNAIGGTEGKDLSTTSTWIDSGDGIRTQSSTSTDVFTRVSVVRGGQTYYTDPRYFFIDFEQLVTDGLLDSIPDSASSDNKPSGSTTSYTGSYSWYVDNTGRVKALYFHLPDSTGYQDGVFP